MKKAYLLLGSNTGDSREILKNAINEIESHVGKIAGSSSMYQTEPWGVKDQNPFINQLLTINTIMDPLTLLKSLLTIEKSAGRERKEKWGPRTLDIDILYYEDEIVVTPELKIPHPEIQNRRFALIPLVEVDPDFTHPVLNLSNKELLKRCTDDSEVLMSENN